MPCPFPKFIKGNFVITTVMDIRIYKKLNNVMSFELFPSHFRIPVSAHFELFGSVFRVPFYFEKVSAHP